MTLLLIVYLVGCALTGAYAFKNLKAEQIGEYFKSAVVVTSIAWPVLVVVVFVLTIYTLFNKSKGI